MELKLGRSTTIKKPEKDRAGQKITRSWSQALWSLHYNLSYTSWEAVHSPQAAWERKLYDHGANPWSLHYS